MIVRTTFCIGDKNCGFITIIMLSNIPMSIMHNPKIFSVLVVRTALMLLGTVSRRPCGMPNGNIIESKMMLIKGINPIQINQFGKMRFSFGTRCMVLYREHLNKIKQAKIPMTNPINNKSEKIWVRL